MYCGGLPCAVRSPREVKGHAVGHAHNSRLVELGVGEGKADKLVLVERLGDLVIDGGEPRLLRDEVHVEITEVFS